MSHQEHPPSTSALDTPGEHGQELHDNAYRHGQEEPGANEVILPRKLPWHEVTTTDALDSLQDSEPIAMDNIPSQYGLHSTTKTHQLGGMFESASVSRGTDEQNKKSGSAA